MIVEGKGAVLYLRNMMFYAHILQNNIYKWIFTSSILNSKYSLERQKKKIERNFLHCSFYQQQKITKLYYLIIFGLMMTRQKYVCLIFCRKSKTMQIRLVIGIVLSLLFKKNFLFFFLFCCCCWSLSVLRVRIDPVTELSISFLFY